MHHKNHDGIDWNEGHPDHEGEMAVTQLHRLAEMATQLLSIIGENDDIPGWVQYKISRAFDDLNSAYSYIEPKSHMVDQSPMAVTVAQNFAEANYRERLRRIIKENVNVRTGR